MALSALDDKARTPTPATLSAVLGRASAHWKALVAHVAEQCDPLEEIWGFAGAKWGWSLRLRQKKRNLLYLTPQDGRFLVGTALGGKARDALLGGRISERLRRVLEEAPKYAEGYGVRVEVRSAKDLPGIKKLLAAKVGV